MANETMVLLEKIVVPSGGASSVTFTSIPQSYTDLKIVVSARVAGSSDSTMQVQFNGSSSSFTYIRLLGDGSTASSGNASNATFGYADVSTYTANTFSNTEIYIPNYTGSNNKSFSADSVSENNATQAIAALHANLWSNTAAITSINIVCNVTTFVQYSTFYLYGVAKQGVTPTNAPAATGGDSIVFDGTYWIHTFTSSGTFTPKKNLTCDYLVVAGGGSGSGSRGSGGGAGGMRCTVGGTGGSGSLESALSLTAQAYTVTIGAGGAGATGDGSNGSNSVFATITATGGGAGSIYDSGVAYSGGSGGGGCGNDNSAAGRGGANPPGGAASPSGQGFAGGNGAGGNGGPLYGNGGGGGGASAAGTNATTGGTMGTGGNGRATSISGTSVTYAGGGGGSGDYRTSGYTTPIAGGSGGGGAGNLNGNGTAGTVNRGGGGGGGGFLNSPLTFYAGGAGGSGIVIVRYAA